MPKNKFNQTTVQSWYSGWKSSKLTQKAYCKANGINFNKFKSKTYELRKKGFLNKNENPISNSFKEVHILEEPKESQEPYCTITFSKNHSITISSKDSLKSLKELIECLHHI